MAIRFLFLLLAAAAALPAVDLGDVTEKHEMVAMRDGVRLSTWLYIPPGDGPWPVAYEQRYAPLTQDITREQSADFARQGYVVALQNFRGAHESEGDFIAYRALGLGDVKDGADTIAWFLKQPWSNGQVASFGASQGGYAQNFLAASQPARLDAQYMVDFGASLFHHGYRLGGTARPMRFLDMCKTAGAPEDGVKMLAQQLQHPAYDDWWKVEDTMLHFEKMSAPTFIVGSYFDTATFGVVETFLGRHKHHPGKVKMILGPWTHGRYNKDSDSVGELRFPEKSKFDLLAHQTEWFEHYIKGKANDIAKQPIVRYYVMGSSEPGAPGHFWRDGDTWPPPSQTKPYFLLDAGRLSADAGEQAHAPSTGWISDPANPAPIPGRSPPSGEDMRSFESHLGVRSFTTAALTAPEEWSGLVKARLYVSSSAKDTDVLVRLTDVYPDGRSLLLVDHIRRMRFRNGYEKQEPLEPGEVYEVEIPVGWISQVFAPGHRIRIDISSAGAPFYELNPQTGEAITAELPAKMVVARNEVHHGGKRRSAIIAPIYRP